MNLLNLENSKHVSIRILQLVLKFPGEHEAKVCGITDKVKQFLNIDEFYFFAAYRIIC